MIDHTWTLFLDRDGIVNERIVGGYVKDFNQFVLKNDFLEAMPKLNSLFGKVIIVTNQQGVGKGLFSLNEVNLIHDSLLKELSVKSISVDKIYVCPHLAQTHCNCRKPEIGMGLRAQKDFPDISFSKSVMIGDALSDLIFGKRLKMKTVFIPESNTTIPAEVFDYADYICNNLVDFYKLIE